MVVSVKIFRIQWYSGIDDRNRIVSATDKYKHNGDFICIDKQTEV